jgi:hypothetical protein
MCSSLANKSSIEWRFSGYILGLLKGRHDIQHKDIQHNDSLHNKNEKDSQLTNVMHNDTRY